MGATRKLQGEIDRVLKKVQEGVEVFDSIWNKVYDTENANQKEKFEADLKKEIKKLQRYRDQIKTWIASSDIKDKKQLMDARKMIEREMERFKVCEKETKTKAFSKEGLGQQPRTDPREKARNDAREWVNRTVAELVTQNDAFEAEIEGLAVKKGKTRPPRLIHLEESLARHRGHVTRLEQVLRLLDNEELNPEDVQEVRDMVDDYVERNQEDFDEFDNVDEMYNSLPMDKLDTVDISDTIVRTATTKEREKAVTAKDATAPPKPPLPSATAAKLQLPTAASKEPPPPSPHSSAAHSDGDSTTNAAPAGSDAIIKPLPPGLLSSQPPIGFKAAASAPPPSAPPVAAAGRGRPAVPATPAAVADRRPAAGKDTPQPVGALLGALPRGPPPGIPPRPSAAIPTQPMPTTMATAVSSGSSTELMRAPSAVTASQPAVSANMAAKPVESDRKSPVAPGPAPPPSPVRSMSPSLGIERLNDSVLPSTETSSTQPAAASSGPGMIGGRMYNVAMNNQARPQGWMFQQSAQPESLYHVQHDLSRVTARQEIPPDQKSRFLSRLQAVQQGGVLGMTGQSALGMAGTLSAQQQHSAPGQPQHHQVQPASLGTIGRADSSGLNQESAAVGDMGDDSGVIQTAMGEMMRIFPGLSDDDVKNADTFDVAVGGPGTLAELSQLSFQTDRPPSQSGQPNQHQQQQQQEPAMQLQAPSHLQTPQPGMQAQQWPPKLESMDDMPALPDHVANLHMLEAAYRYIPLPIDSERPKAYTPRNPAHVPSSYPSVPSAMLDNPALFERFDTDTLFFCFYYQQGTYQQYLAACELKKQSWRYHKKYNTWFQRHEEPKVTTDEYEQGTYVYFDFHIVHDDYQTGWCQRIKTEFTFEYKYLEDELVV
eukprot:jgi/Chlat1/7767/Chrsp66S07233